jgi:hypothetical protein
MTADATGPENKIYVDCMIQLRERLECIEWLQSTAAFIRGDHFFLTELIFLQFRKTLELLALASLAAHRDRYSQANAKFREHWKAKAILEAIERLNPGFYPRAVRLASRTQSPSGRNRANYEVIKDNVLTQAEFAQLYDASSEVLHTRNPFSEKPEAIDVLYPPLVWVDRIRQLLRTHFILIDNEALLVHVPDKGKVVVQTALSDDTVR